jgi:hypothetical protein
MAVMSIEHGYRLTDAANTIVAQSRSANDPSTVFQLFENGTDFTFFSPINDVFDDIELFAKSKPNLV